MAADGRPLVTRTSFRYLQTLSPRLPDGLTLEAHSIAVAIRPTAG